MYTTSVGKSKGLAIIFIILVVLVISVIALLFTIVIKRKSDSGTSDKSQSIYPLNKQIEIKNREKPEKEKYPGQTDVHTYVNEKFNFKVDYPDNKAIDVDTFTIYELEKNDKNISVIRKSYNEDHWVSSVIESYEIIDVEKINESGFKTWWSGNITNEIGGYNVPDDYEATLNNIMALSCIKGANPNWEPPLTLEVHPRDEVTEPGPYTGTTYYYYDFGNPFILKTSGSSTGACGGSDSYMMVATIRRAD